MAETLAGRKIAEGQVYVVSEEEDGLLSLTWKPGTVIVGVPRSVAADRLKADVKRAGSDDEVDRICDQFVRAAASSYA